MSREAELNSPDTWLKCMRAGNFEQAWKFSDKVVAAGINRDYATLPRHYQCIWDGTPLEGKRVLIRCYHGLGDTIQFIRYVPLVKKIAKQVIVWAQPALLKLLETVQGIDLLLPLHDGIPEVEYDIDIEVMELPHVFRSTITTIPNSIPYLHAEPMQLPKLHGEVSIGLVWKAGDWDPSRCIPFSCLAPLNEISGVKLFILQAGASSAGWQEGFGIHPGEFDLYNYARLIRGLDLVITVDSMPAHLAGALNVPVWTLLHAGADWRWMDNQLDSPWYPSMRLLRQAEPNNWEQLITEVTAELEKLAVAAKTDKI